jgi:RNA polymerase sigma factor (sigma-70 family)
MAASTSTTTFLRQLRRIIVAQCPSNLADDELLRQFIGERDEMAFALLVRRHGSMVLGVCGNVLRHQQDAEDVFQATFLLLARKADTIRKHQSLSSWLHGVAYRLALKTRTQNNRRHAHEQTALPTQRLEFGDDLSVRESRVLLHEEMNRLPEKYRAVLLLCYWEGKTRDEAAARLGMTPDALKKRLERARNLLGSRLTRRGLAPTVALFTWLISENGARAAVSSLLIQNTAQAAVAFASTQSVAVGASTTAVTLAQGAIRMMLLTKCFTILLTLLAVIGGGTAIGYAGYGALAGNQPDTVPVVVLQAQPKPKAAAPPVQKTDAERIVGTWKIVNGIADGKNAFPAEVLAIGRFIFHKDGKMNFMAGEHSETSTYKIVGPGKLDALNSLGVGIYQFNGDDRLTLCCRAGKDPARRPTEFSAEKGATRVLIKLERAKPGKENPTAEQLAKNNPGINKLRETELRKDSMNNLRQIALAMHNYDAAYKGFPRSCDLQQGRQNGAVELARRDSAVYRASHTL